MTVKTEEKKIDMALVYKHIIEGVGDFGNSYSYELPNGFLISGSKLVDSRNEIPIITFKRLEQNKPNKNILWEITDAGLAKIYDYLHRKKIEPVDIKSEKSNTQKSYRLVQLCRNNVIVTFLNGQISVPAYKDFNDQIAASALVSAFDQVLNKT